MIIKEIQDQDKEKWNSFAKNYSFLQSWQWGELQKDLGKKFWRSAVLDGDEILLLALIYKNDLPFGLNYLYSPRGPLISKKDPEVFKLFLEKIKEISEQENSIFFRMDPEWQNEDLLEGFGFKKWIKEVQPKDTLILDLSKDEDALLKEMHQKTRYNIRLAERKGVKVKFSNSKEDFEKFWKLIKETTERDKFKAHPKEYYWKILQNGGDKVGLVLAEYENKIIAANLISFFGKTATYMHGASSSEYRNLMAPHLLQWESIKEAKNRGCQNYDFWGVAPTDDKNHPWAGITRFKKSFSPDSKITSYIGAWDLVFNNFWYFLYKCYQKIK